MAGGRRWGKACCRRPPAFHHTWATVCAESGALAACSVRESCMSCVAAAAVCYSSSSRRTTQQEVDARRAGVPGCLCLAASGMARYSDRITFARDTSNLKCVRYRAPLAAAAPPLVGPLFQFISQDSRIMLLACQGFQQATAWLRAGSRPRLARPRRRVS